MATNVVTMREVMLRATVAKARKHGVTVDDDGQAVTRKHNRRSSTRKAYKAARRQQWS